MTSYIIAALALMTVAAVALAGVQSSRLSTAEAQLSSTQIDLAAARADRDRIARDRNLAVSAMTAERDRALQSEVEASHLKEEIARLAGTQADGPTAPVLRKTLQGLHRTASRQDALYVGRPKSWRLAVIVKGRLERLTVTKDRKACDELAAAVAIELVGRPEVIVDADSVRIRCELVERGETA